MQEEQKPNGYNEAFVEFWCDRKGEGLIKLPFWRWHQEKVDTYGGPCKIWWGVTFVEAPEFCPVDAWELRGAISAGELQEQDLEALLKWAQANETGPGAVWPAVLVFMPQPYPVTPENLARVGQPIPF